MHIEAKVSKIILQNDAMLEGAAQEKVCQTDKCSAHNDNKNCYGLTLMRTISLANQPVQYSSPSSGTMIINLLGFPPLTAHMQTAALQGACTQATDFNCFKQSFCPTVCQKLLFFHLSVVHC